MTSQTVTELREAAYALIPGYAECVRALATAKAWPRPKLPVSDLDADLWTAAAEGRPLPGGILAAYAERLSAFNAIGELENAIESVRSRAEFELKELLREESAPALAYLDDELRALMSEVAKLDASAPATVEQAVHAGGKAAQEWRALTAAVGRYDAIRALQRELVKNADPDWTNTPSITAEMMTGVWRLGVSGMFADAIDVEPYWIERRRDTALRMQDGHSTAVQEYAQWLALAKPAPFGTSRTGWWPEGADRVDFLRWVATSTRAWVPDLDALTAAHEANTEATARLLWGDGIRVDLDSQLRRNADARAHIEALS
ncbi:hypothetical protein [Aeromicrobium sp. JJY06]|uniref:hypothetical protein n=1 Tax=Aeromicrobium sp. JJY06 TaxID=3373478 RepID=UPI00376ED893